MGTWIEAPVFAACVPVSQQTTTESRLARASEFAPLSTRHSTATRRTNVAVASPELIFKDRWVPEPLQFKQRAWMPRTPFGQVVKDCLTYLPADLAADLIDRVSSAVVMHSSLWAIHRHRDPQTGLWIEDDHGEVSHHVITDTGVAFLVDSWQGILEPEIMKYHGVGTGTTAESAAHTALVTESTTALNPDSTRATGSLTEGASANIFRTVGTVTFDASAAITEHGLFSQAATGGGTMIDRSVFSAINVVSADSIAFTWDGTFSSGG